MVTVAYVEDAELAERYRHLLLENAVPAAIRKTESAGEAKFSDIALQVPEEFLEPAYNLLTQQAVVDDFFATVFGSEGSRTPDETDSDEDGDE
jgi:hypothetical protein